MKVYIKNNSVFPERIFALGRGSYGFDRLDFVFSKEWHALTKRIIFVSPKGERITAELENNSVQIPESILCSRGKSLVFATGAIGRRKLVSVSAELWVIGELPEKEEQA